MATVRWTQCCNRDPTRQTFVPCLGEKNSPHPVRINSENDALAGLSSQDPIGFDALSESSELLINHGPNDNVRVVTCDEGRILLGPENWHSSEMFYQPHGPSWTSTQHEESFLPFNAGGDGTCIEKFHINTRTDCIPYHESISLASDELRLESPFLHPMDVSDGDCLLDLKTDEQDALDPKKGSHEFSPIADCTIFEPRPINEMVHNPRLLLAIKT